MCWGSSDPTQLNTSSPCPRSSLSLPVLPLSWLLSPLSPSQGTTSWRSLAALWTRSFFALGKLKLPGTTAGTLLISRAVLLEKLGCSLDQVILCAGEIEAAWNNCWDSADIQGCIAGIVGASDCGLCICDVLGWLGLMEC